MRLIWPTCFIFCTIWYSFSDQVFGNKTESDNGTVTSTTVTVKPLTTAAPEKAVSKSDGPFQHFRVFLENCESAYYIWDAIKCIFEQNDINMDYFIITNCTDDGRNTKATLQFEQLATKLADDKIGNILAVVSTRMMSYMKSIFLTSQAKGMLIDEDMQVDCPADIKQYYIPDPEIEDPNAQDTLLWADPLNENLYNEEDFDDEDCWFKSVFPKKVIELPTPVMDGIEKICTIAAMYKEDNEDYPLLSTLQRLLLRQIDLFSKTTLVPNCTCYNEIPERETETFYPKSINLARPIFFPAKSFANPQTVMRPPIVEARLVHTKQDIAITPQVSHAQRRFDMKTAHIYVGTYHHPPYMFVNTTPETGQMNFSGYLIDVLDLMAKTYNFTYTVLVPDELEKGNYVNFRWTGVIGMVNRSEVEIGLSDFILNYERAEAVDFSSAFIDFQYTGVLIKRPVPGDLANKLGVYLKPFGEDVWYASLVIVSLSVIFIHIVFRIRKWVGGMTEEEYPDELQTSRLLLLGVQAVAQQGCEFDINGLSSRIIFFLLWIFTMLIHIYYNANLMSYLTVNAVEWPFHNYPSLVYSGYRLGIIRDTQRMEMFMTSPLRLHQVIWKKISYDWSNRTIENVLDDGAKRTLKEKYALIHADPFLQYMARNSCDYGIIERLGDWTPVYPIFKKNSSLIRPFDVMLRRLYMTGMLDFYRKKWYGKTAHCQSFKEDFVVMSVYSVATAFMILGSGMGLGFIFIIIENLSYKYGKKRTIQKVGENPIYTVSHATVAE